VTDLSPAAQAVRDAAFEPWQSTDTPESIAAAALRAAADQCADGVTHWELYAIAAELEGADA